MHRVGYILTDGFQALALGTQSIFEVANRTSGKSFYSVENFSIDGGEVRSSQGMVVSTKPLGAPSVADTWIVIGVLNPLESTVPPKLLAFLKQKSQRSRRIVSICTGSFALAQAGLLNARRATTHWAYAAELQKRFPAIHVEHDRIYIADGNVWTSAGMTAGQDLVLALVEQDMGETIARSMAHKLVMYHRRAGGQSQHSEMLALAPKSDRIQNALNYAQKNLSRALTVEELAAAVHLSSRQFTRVFTAETGETPAKAIEKLRLEAARLMIEQSRHPLDVVAKETGFRDRRHMREVFVRGFGIPPLALRRGARSSQ